MPRTRKETVKKYVTMKLEQQEARMAEAREKEASRPLTLAEQLQAASKMLKKVDPEQIKRDSEKSVRESPKFEQPQDKNARILALTQQLNAALNQKKRREENSDDSDDNWENSSESGSDK